MEERRERGKNVKPGKVASLAGAQPGDLAQIPGTHGEEENCLSYKLFSDLHRELWYAFMHACEHTRTHTHFTHIHIYTLIILNEYFIKNSCFFLYLCG